MWRASLAILVLAAGAAGIYWFAGDGVATVVRPSPVPTVGPRASVSDALSQPVRRRVRFQRLGPPILGFRDLPFPFLAGEDATASVSLGTVTTGSLVNARELTLPGDHYSILPRQLLRGLRFGTSQIIDLIRRAAREVADQYPDAVLWVGNIARHGGGDIPYSVSHNDGRDADLAFYFTNDAGQVVAPPDLLSVGRDLTATADGVVYHFDPVRTWALVRALVSQDEAPVQYLFIASWLERALLDEARREGERSALIERAAEVLTQPGGTAGAHDDHLHVRLYCSPDDAARGCIDTGRRHPWIPDAQHVRAAALNRLRDTLRSDDAEQRARAIERLVLMDSQADLRRVVERLSDESPRVRAAAARAVGALGGPGQVESLVTAWEGEADGDVLAALVDALAKLGGDQAVSFLVARLDAPAVATVAGRSLDMRALVADALGRMEVSRAVEPLVPLLGSADPLVRARAAWALGRLANIRLGRDWEDPDLDARTRHDGLEAWQTWVDAHGSEPRDSWLVSGFGAAGFPVLDGGVDLTALAAATGATSPFVRYNAQRALMRLLDRDVPSLGWSARDASWYWQAAVLDPRK